MSLHCIFSKYFLAPCTMAFDMYYRGYIGTFGWLDTNLLLWLINLAYLGILFVAIFENNRKINFNLFQRIVLLGSLLAMIALVLLSQHLTWDCVGVDRIATIQGRYFIPAFPLLFMLFNNANYNRPVLTSGIVMLLSVILLSFSIWTIYFRYYVTPHFDSTLFSQVYFK